ncbi:MAG: sigma-54-dependent Fis family transcriptional regulator, partial [Bacteroidetes bacterium]|nr:sigma-54-dependent Fis family transcriptional regulator [Bacteroidota bacterium]
MEKHECILIVDDDKIVRESLFNWFEYEGYIVDKAENGSAALEKFKKGKYDLALLDMKMPGIDGLELLKRMKKIDDGCIYILITAYASIPTAIKALKDGANDYISKPIDPDELSQLVRNALEQKLLEKENRLLKDNVDELIMPVNLASKSKQMKRIKEMVYNAAHTDSTVLLTGERGTGKELVAKTIHINSKRKQLPFIIADCETLSEPSFKKDLLGFEKLEQNKNI